MIGVVAVADSERSMRVASMPEIFGSWMSIRIRSGRSSTAFFRPDSPSCASDQGVARLLEQVAQQLAVQRVVLDVENLFAAHVAFGSSCIVDMNNRSILRD